MKPEEIAARIVAAVTERKARDIAVIHVTELTTLADYYVVCSGTSATQLRAIADAAEAALAAHGMRPKHVEGTRAAGWILQDFGSVVVHIMKQDMREFYGLERLWADGTRIDPAEFTAAHLPADTV